MRRFIHFLTYNNAIPIVLGILFLSSGLVFAANEEVREFVADSVFEAEQRVVSIDNSYISNKNLDAYSPKVSISGVTEDSEFYYIEYTFTTIALAEGVWQDVAQQKTMQVDRNVLGQYVDLGVYVTEQLKQLVDREIAYLQEVQGIERRQVTNKVVATAYSGLVGQFIDENTEQLPGYVPLVSEPVVEEVDPAAIARAEKGDVIPFDFAAAQINSDSNNSSNSNSDNTEEASVGPVITILGANPARIPLNASYSDLGAVTTSQEGVTLGLSISLSLNGDDVSNISIDTTTVSDWTVGYSATDSSDVTSFVERVVIVYDPNATTVEEEDTATTATTTEEVATTTEEVATTTQETATTTEETTETATTTEQATEDTATTTETTQEETATTTQEQTTETAATTEETATTTEATQEETATTTEETTATSTATSTTS
ncbi:MAG: hypothetical protein JKX80_02945 [Candidatus Pacebacteria bacterium]|nr:hypothetical protein [Candidatus Paceibacterota bacterium]